MGSTSCNPRLPTYPASNIQLFETWYCRSKVQFSVYGSLLLGSYPPNRKGPNRLPLGQHPGNPQAVCSRLGSDVRNAEPVPGGGGGTVVPNGCDRLAFLAAAIGSTNGGANVTPNGPLNPAPALGEK